jgi:VanZ family protein
MAVIFVFSARPSDELPYYGVWDLIIKKGAHLAEYAILGWLIQRARGDRRAWWQSLLMAVAYAATDEFHQSFVPGRHPRVADVMIDAAGVAIGLIVAIRRTTPPRSPLPAPRRPQ